MTSLETQVWAAAFAAEFSRQHEFFTQHGKPERVSGFNCAEIADIAVEKLREALASDDAQYLTLVKEGGGR